jgi:hypothetical protein
MLLDPSFVMSRPGFQWLASGGGWGEVILPLTFRRWLEGEIDLDIAAVVAPHDRRAIDYRRKELLGITTGMGVFSSSEVDLRGGSRDVLGALLGIGGLNAELLADEWAFLQSQSWMTSKLRRPYEAFRDAGATIIEVGAKVGDRLITSVIPANKVPPVLTAKFRAIAAAKWIGVGGVTVGASVLGGALGIAGAAGGAYAGEKLASAVVGLIDP